MEVCGGEEASWRGAGEGMETGCREKGLSVRRGSSVVHRSECGRLHRMLRQDELCLKRDKLNILPCLNTKQLTHRQDIRIL